MFSEAPVSAGEVCLGGNSRLLFSNRHRLLLKAQHPVISHLAFAPNRRKKNVAAIGHFAVSTKPVLELVPNYVVVLSKPSISKSPFLSAICR